ncbi:MAG TPA: carbohydrate ABC transporter permease [Chloroflexia bacterium]|nr:carbohydrate ABC transporter permease [Chloroflexia bacterium]
MAVSTSGAGKYRQPFSLRKTTRQWAFVLLVLLIVFFCLSPFAWLLFTSLKQPQNLYKRDPDLLPIPISFENYINVFNGQAFGVNIWNSFLAATGATIACLIIGVFAGYSLGRVQFRGRNFLLGLVLAVSMFPGIAIIAPLYLFFTDLHLTNQLPALWLPYITFNLPLTVWLLAAFFKDLPAELEEAAEVDGATPFRAFWNVIMPLATPGVATAAILIFINAWNEFLFARTFMSTNKTAPVAIQSFAGLSEFSVPWGDISAGAVIVTVPLVLLVIFFQRRIISGLTSGAIKG